MVLQKRIERKTASLLLYALQIASSNLKRIDLEKPQPEQVVIDVETETESETPMAAVTAAHTAAHTEDKTASEVSDEDLKRSGEDLPPGTIHACASRCDPRLYKWESMTCTLESAASRPTPAKNASMGHPHFIEGKTK
jgi:hypothetical protein